MPVANQEKITACKTLLNVPGYAYWFNQPWIEESVQVTTGSAKTSTVTVPRMRGAQLFTVNTEQVPKSKL